jgi:hypothetical protein
MTASARVQHACHGVQQHLRGGVYLYLGHLPGAL